MRLLKNMSGDTIVEVMIATAVAMAVLGSSYIVVNHTSLNARQAQEHGEALEIANQQVEYISSVAQTDPTNLFSIISTYHCVNPTTGALIQINGVSSLPADESKYPAACKNLGSVGYRTAFKYDAVHKYFLVYVNWPSVTGNGDDQVNLSFKAYKLP